MIAITTDLLYHMPCTTNLLYVGGEFMILVGYKAVAGKSKRTGGPVNGVVVYWQSDEDNEVQGLECGSEYLPSEIIRKPLQIGYPLKLLYNREGRIEVVMQPEPELPLADNPLDTLNGGAERG